MVQMALSEAQKLAQAPHFCGLKSSYLSACRSKSLKTDHPHKKSPFGPFMVTTEFFGALLEPLKWDYPPLVDENRGFPSEDA